MTYKKPDSDWGQVFLFYFTLGFLLDRYARRHANSCVADYILPKILKGLSYLMGLFTTLEVGVFLESNYFRNQTNGNLSGRRNQIPFCPKICKESRSS